MRPIRAREAHAPGQTVTEMITAKATLDAIRASQILFGGDLTGRVRSHFPDVAGEVPTQEIDRQAGRAGDAAGGHAGSFRDMPKQGSGRERTSKEEASTSTTCARPACSGRDIRRPVFGSTSSCAKGRRITWS